MVEQIVVVGGGGFGRETLDVIDALIAAGERLRIVGVVDAGLSDQNLLRLRDRGVPYLGTEEEWLARATGNERIAIGIGAPTARAGVARRLAGVGLRAVTLIHPRAVIGSRSEIGEGAVIAAGVQVSTNVSLGDYVHLNPGCVVGHDARLASFVSVNPGAIVSGSVNVEARALIGAGSVVLQGLNVGAGATVGAAACVTSDVVADSTVVGVPARIAGSKDKRS